MISQLEKGLFRRLNRSQRRVKAELDGYAEIIDGQQRLTTCTILAAVIRDLAIGKHQDVADTIQSQFIEFETSDPRTSNLS